MASSGNRANRASLDLRRLFEESKINHVLHCFFYRSTNIQLTQKRLYNKPLLEFFSLILNYSNVSVLLWKELAGFFIHVMKMIHTAMETKRFMIKMNSRLVSPCSFSFYLACIPFILFSLHSFPTFFILQQKVGVRLIQGS